MTNLCVRESLPLLNFFWCHRHKTPPTISSLSQNFDNDVFVWERVTASRARQHNKFLSPLSGISRPSWLWKTPSSPSEMYLSRYLPLGQRRIINQADGRRTGRQTSQWSYAMRRQGRWKSEAMKKKARNRTPHCSRSCNLTVTEISWSWCSRFGEFCPCCCLPTTSASSCQQYARNLVHRL